MIDHVDWCKTRVQGNIGKAYIVKLNKTYSVGSYRSFQEISSGAVCLFQVQVNGGCYVLSVTTSVKMGDYENYPKELIDYGSMNSILSTIGNYGEILLEI